ncbi:MAG TPA: hypothetical protein VEG60_01820 [Candidatus Binatia bacterium]|nr:hypothetical protein [Candidatus Binatia bacterium]
MKPDFLEVFDKGVVEDFAWFAPDYGAILMGVFESFRDHLLADRIAPWIHWVKWKSISSLRKAAPTSLTGALTRSREPSTMTRCFYSTSHSFTDRLQAFSS